MVEYGEWTIFNGGPCPLKEGERAQAQFEDQSRHDALDTKPMPWAFDSAPDGNAIVAFRRVIEQKPVVVPMTYARKLNPPILDGHRICWDSPSRDFTITITGDTIEAEWVE